MLHRIFRLTDIKYIETITEDLEYGQDIVIVRPTYLSICAADQRYFFGKRKKAIMQKKLQRFSFAEEIYFSDMPPEDFKLDHCFECVGGSKAEDAINQMIDMINPQGIISLLGVSEELVGLNTRMILEKGLQLIGNSRSVARDMQAAVDLIGGDEAVGQYLQTIISNECDVRSVDDIYNAFELDKLGDFKTVIHWNV